MLSRKNDIIQFDLSRCVQCGTCLAACPSGALRKTLRNDGLWEFAQNKKQCSRCYKCIAVCPAHTLPKKKILKADLSKVQHLLLVHAKESEVRTSASSGGAARIFARNALESGYADAVYSVAKASKYPWAKGRLWKEPMNTSELANSMYLPVLVNEHLNSVRNERTILLIGTTCQLLAAERYLKKRCGEIIKIAIFCKQQKNIKSTCFMAKRLGLPPFDRSGTQVEYRGGNWPGQVKINGRKMEWEAAAALPYGKRLWRVPGCRMCSNPFGVGADLSLADPWGIDKTGDPGNTLITVWTEKGRELIDACKAKLNVTVIDGACLPSSVTWKDIRRKRYLTDYYLGRNVSLNIRLAGLAEQFQTSLFETLLEKTRLPYILYRIMARFPDLPDFFLKK